VIAETQDVEEPRLSGQEDPRDRDRQVADVVARLCAIRRGGEAPAGALWAALDRSSAPICRDLLAVVATSCLDDARWAGTSLKLHQLARRWRSPILATLADAYSDGGYALDVDYLHAVAVGTGAEHSTPPALALKRMNHARHGMPWDDDEDRQLREAFEQGVTIDGLMEQHQRNRNAIRARLVRLGVLEDDPSG
jgi:hypothetical protein